MDKKTMDKKNKIIPTFNFKTIIARLGIKKKKPIENNISKSPKGGSNNDSLLDLKNNSFVIQINDVNNVEVKVNQNKNIRFQELDDVDLEENKQLHKAVIERDIEAVGTLLKKTPSFIIKNKIDEIVVREAVKSNDEAVIDLFVKKSTEIGRQDSIGVIMISQAVSSFSINPDILEVLKRKGLSLELKDKSGRSPLLLAIHLGNGPAATLLIEHFNVDIETRDNNGRTPVIYAVREQCKAILELLIKKGANPYALDKKNLRPIDYARQNDDTTLIGYLCGVMAQNKHLFNYNFDCNFVYQ